MHKGIVCLKHEGIFAGALIKKQRYCSSKVPGDAFESHFSLKLVGDTGIVSGKLNGFECFIWGMEEPNYVMKVMGTGGALVTEGCKEVHWKLVDGNKLDMAKCHNTKTFHCHFHYCHVVDDHNNSCQHSIALRTLRGQVGALQGILYSYLQSLRSIITWHCNVLFEMMIQHQPI